MREYFIDLLIGPLIAVTTAFSQPPVPDTLWTGTYGGPGDEICYSVQQTRDGGYVLGGVYEATSVSQDDMYLIKIDRIGRMVWDQTYGGGSNECCRSVHQTNDGGYALAGFTYSYGSGLSDFYLVRTDSLGNQQWDQTYGTGSSDRLECMQPTADGGYILGGYTGPPYGEDMYLVKTDSLGNLEWDHTYGGSGVDGCYSVQQTSDGGYILGGQYDSAGFGGMMWLVKTDDQGNMQWDQTFGYAGNGRCYCVQQTTDGGYILGGRDNFYGPNNGDLYLVKADARGNLEWEETYGVPGGNICFDIIQTPDQGYLAGGEGDGHMHVLKIDSVGTPEWEKFIYDSNTITYCYSLSTTADGSFVFGGFYMPIFTSNTDIYLVLLDGLQQAWVTLTPQNPPVVIPSGGGSFQFNLQLSNCGTVSCTVDAWVMVTLPDSSVLGPVLGPVDLTLPVGTSLDRHRTQFVPGRAPAGVYAYNAYAGEYPDNVWHQSSFSFSKEGGADDQGEASLSDWTISGRDDESSPAEHLLPSSFLLFHPYPNPFNPTTTIRFALPQASRIKLTVHDISGRLVSTLVDGWREAGQHDVSFDASDLASGLYLARLQIGDYTASQKMVLVK